MLLPKKGHSPATPKVRPILKHSAGSPLKLCYNAYASGLETSSYRFNSGLTCLAAARPSTSLFVLIWTANSITVRCFWNSERVQ